jgi:peroxiredoxin
MNTANNACAGLRNTAGTFLLCGILWLCPLATPAGEPSEVPAAPPPGFSLPDTEGQQRSLDEFAGRVVLVTFWASWCRPCIEEMPSIQRLEAAMAQAPFSVVGVNVGEGIRRVQATVKRLRMTFPVLLDKDSATFEDWGANVLPTAYILDGSSRVRYVARGPVEWDRPDIVDRLKHLAAEQPAGHE